MLYKGKASDLAGRINIFIIKYIEVLLCAVANPRGRVRLGVF